nr:replication protein A 70 kDa DNA-binding subunit B-like [Ipomoea batatas]
MAPMYVLVEELDKDRTSVAIRLMAVRTYNVWHSRGRDQIKSRECVFHDEVGSYIHLHIPGKCVSPKNDFVEGNVYYIKNFLLVAHYYCYKTCEGEYMMKVFSETLIKPYKGCDFPRYMYRLKPFEVLNTLDANILVAGEVKICSYYDATKLLFNENSLEFVEFRNSLSMQQQTPLKSITSNSTFSYGTTSGVESSSKMKITTLSDIFSKREADELKAMQPSVMTKVPKDIRNLKGKGLFFKISVKSETFDKMENTIPVLQVKHFPEMFETYCPGLIQHNDDEFSSKLQLTQDDSDSDEGFFSDDPTESPIAATPGKQDEACNETEAVKRSLMDEFSSTQPSKKKKDVVVKMEDEKEQGDEH